MKDFPVFPTEYGIASLVLREIPYRGCAYIHIRDSLEPEKLMEECVSFCRMCGAERIFATGHDWLQRFPLYAVLLEMRCAAGDLPDTDAALFPLQEKTLGEFRRIYNEKAAKIPCGAWMTEKDAGELLRQGSGYFVHRGEKLLGIGIICDGEIRWVASIVPGAGRDVVCALAHASADEMLRLTVAAENRKALAMYETLGFYKTAEKERWYDILHKPQENNS